jgi:protein TonB
MAVQILNDMPDVAIHRGDPGTRPAARAIIADPVPAQSLSDWSPRASRGASPHGRPLFIAVTIGVHVLAILGFLSVRHVTAAQAPPKPIEVSIIDAPVNEEAPPMAPPPMQEVVYSLPVPDPVAFEVDSITTPTITAVTHAQPSPHSAVPPMVETVEYVRPPAPVYPRESSRRREFGTVLLRVLVDPSGRPAQIQVERSSGFERLDLAARSAVEKALFRPHEVDGIAQAAQVLIPIEFTRRAG